MQRSLPALLLGLVLGAALGAIAAWSLLDEGPVLAGAAGSRPGRASASHTAARNTELAGPDGGGGYSAPVAAERPKVTKADAARLLDRVETARVETPRIVAARGGDVLRGQVQTESGAPLGGVTIVVNGSSRLFTPPALDPTSVGAGAPEPSSLVDAVRATAERFEQGRAMRRRVTSDAAGQFVIEGLPEDRDWSLTGYKPDWSIGTVRLTAERAVPAKLIARPVVTVKVQVELPGGEAPELASIHWSRVRRTEGDYSSRSGKQAWSPDQPIVRLAAGAYELHASTGRELPTGRGFGSEQEFESEDQKFTVEPGGEDTLRFELQGQRAVSGRLLPADDGVEGTQYAVHLAPIGAAGFDPSAPPRGQSIEGYRIREGFYRFVDLEPGPHALYATFERTSRAVVHELVDVAEGLLEQDLQLQPLDTTSVLRVTVFGPDGNKVSEGLNFNWNMKRENSSNGAALPSLGRQDGDWLFDVSNPQFLYMTSGAESQYTLSLSSAEWGSRTLPLKPGQLFLEYTISQAVSLAVTVEGMQRLAPSSQVRVQALAADGSGGQSAEVDARGTCEVGPMEVGDYRVSLDSNVDYRDRSRGFFQGTLAWTEVSVGAGTAATLEVPSLHELVVRVSEDQQGERVRLSTVDERGGRGGGSFGRRTSGGSAEAVPGEDGRARFSGLPAGRYQLRAGRARMEIDVPCGEVLLRHTEKRAMQVSIIDSAGVLAKSGLRSGDLIVGMGGEEFKDEGASRRLALIMSAEVELLVRRGGRNITLKAGPWNIRDEKSMGGELTPVSPD